MRAAQRVFPAARHEIKLKGTDIVNSQIVSMLIPAGAIVLGGIIGFAFGALQKKALLAHKKRQEEGKLGSGWAIMPGSMGRVAVLLVTLALVQIIFPMFFEGSTIPWLVSAGVVIGYGAALFLQLRHHAAYRA